MILPILANVEWPSAIVASVLIVCLTGFFITAVIRHKMQEVEKLAGYFAGTLGILLGVFITYFFTSQQIQRQESQTKILESAYRSSEEAKLAAAKQVSTIAAQLKSRAESPESRKVAEYLEFVAKDLQPTWGRMGGLVPEVKISPSPHATASAPDTFFHDLLNGNTPRPSPSANP
jgi:hypothetical protein